MSEQLPIVDELEGRTTFAGMAQWLMTCPLAVIATHHDQIRTVLVERNFFRAAAYLAAYVAALHACRAGEFAYPEGEGGSFDLSGKDSDKLLSDAHDVDEVIRAIKTQKLDWWAVDD